MRCVLVAGLAAAISLCGAGPARAQAGPPPRIVYAVDRHPYALWREFWIGGAHQAASSSVYSGSTVALGGDIDAPGWRLRTTAGYGRYTYRKWLHGRDGPTYAKLTGRNLFSDVLLGYQLQWPRVTVKAFAGLTSERHIVDPRERAQGPAHDRGRPTAEQSYGGKAALEAWLVVSPRLWVAADASLASTHASRQLGLRTGYAVFERLDLGVETRLARHHGRMAGRLGGFATWRLGDAGITVAAGASGDSDRRAGTYGHIGLFLRY